MNITLIDSNAMGIETMIKALGICRGNECTDLTLQKALEAKPVPHMSVLEFGWVCLLVEGISVKTRLQLLRSRLFSTMERSTRALYMGEVDCVTPETVKCKDCFGINMSDAMSNYKGTIEEGETLEDSSYLLPMGIGTDFFLAGNLRVWFEYFQKRLCIRHVQREHYRMAIGMFNEIKTIFPIISKAHPCEACGVCKGLAL